MVKKYGDIIAGVFSMILAVSLYIASFFVKQFNVVKLGAGFVPKLVAIIIFTFGGMLVFNGYKHLKNFKSSNSEKKESEVKADNYAVTSTLVLLLIYVSLLEKIGFIVMTILYLFIQLNILAHKPQRNLVQFAVISIVTSVSGYYLFVNVFKVMLPSGILG